MLSPLTLGKYVYCNGKLMYLVQRFMGLDYKVIILFVLLPLTAIPEKRPWQRIFEFSKK